MTDIERAAIAEILGEWYDGQISTTFEMWIEEDINAIINTANANLNKHQKMFGLTDEACGITYRELPRNVYHRHNKSVSKKGKIKYGRV